MARWDDAFLEGMRQVGDEPGARLLDALLEIHPDPSALRTLNRALASHAPLDDQLFPPQLRGSLDGLEPPPAFNFESVFLGQELFAAYGPEIMMILGCYSLPAAYAANYGARVLNKTEFLESWPTRRFLETFQMVMDVMSPGGLEASGRGVETARRVRLMHAAIRRLILADGSWDSALFGVPINQEDLAGTLMTFSWVILDGLRRIGVDVGHAHAQGYLDAWRVVGELLGIDRNLIPRDMLEARELTNLVAGRQIRLDEWNEDGHQLTAALLGVIEKALPRGVLHSTAGSMIRLFLSREVADSLGVPRLPLRDPLLRGGIAVRRLLLRWSGSRRGDCPPGVSCLPRSSIRFLEALTRMTRDGQRPTFDIPKSLQDQLQRPEVPAVEGVWRRLGDRLQRRFTR